MRKKNLIKGLLVTGLPVYGIGNYVSAVYSPTVGYFVSISFYLLVILFCCIDSIYQRTRPFRITGSYWLVNLFLLSCCASLFIALAKGLPETNIIQVSMKSVLLIVPFQAFVLASLQFDLDSDWPRTILWGLSLLLAINLVGFFGLGLNNQVHSIEGRINFPFLDGFYSGAGLVSIINLTLLYYIHRYKVHPGWCAAMVGYFLLNLAILFAINSRMATLVFILVVLFYLFRIIRARFLFALSLLTLPILLNSTSLVYEILNIPALSPLMQRVDIEDVTTFNGRAYLWNDAINWMTNDQRGLWLGNGYRGHYFLGLTPDVAKLWNIEDADLHHLHLHSTSLETIVSQGLLSFIVFIIILYRIYRFFRERKTEMAALFPSVIFLLFILEVDTFVYMEGLGSVIFAMLAASIAVERKESTTPTPQPIQTERSYVRKQELVLAL